MTIKLYPVKIEAYCDVTKDHLFTCSTVDNTCAELELKTAVRTDTWPELSDAILKALEMMK